MFITPKSLTITQLLSSESEQYIVPAYQRRYSWQEKQIWELVDDVRLLEGSDTHLFGSIVCLTGHHTAGINKLELVDGQQRLTTLCVLLQCIADRLKQEGETGAAQDVDRLLQAKALGEPPIAKVLLDSLDAGDFAKLMSGKELDEPQNLNLAEVFSRFRKWVAEQPLPALGSFLYRLKNQCIVIRLEVSDAKDAFKLFEIINNRGLHLSPTDIVKNFILGNAARFGPSSLELARERWSELIQHLDGVSIDAFLRQFLIARLKRRVTKSYVIRNFKALFMQKVAEASQLPERHYYADEAEAETDEDDGQDSSSDLPTLEVGQGKMQFADFLADLVGCAKVYGEVVLGKTGVAQVDRRLRNLRMIKFSQTYGFLMHLRVSDCDVGDFERILGLTEALMIRRHTCRERANENETLFARLCSIDPKQNPVDKVIKEFQSFCPTDERFREAFGKTQYNPNLIDRARYCLEQFEYKRQGKYLELIVGGTDSVHVEHIMPQKIKTAAARNEFGDWPAYLGAKWEALHPDYVSRIGNLTLFAGPLNIGASNNPYERKKTAYVQSAIKLTNTLPVEYPEFRFEQVDARSAALADLAVTLWPMP